MFTIIELASMSMALVLSMLPMLLAPVSRVATVFLMSSTTRVSRPSRVMESGLRKPRPGDHLHLTLCYLGLLEKQWC